MNYDDQQGGLFARCGAARRVQKGICLIMAFLLAACMVPLAPASAAGMAAGSAPGLQADGTDRISELLGSMTLDEKVSQMIVPAFRTWDGENATDLAEASGLAAALQKHRYGGVVLFGQNITGSGQVARFTTALQANNAQIAGAGARVPYLMCVDGEGGVVSRLATGSRMTGSMAIGATGAAAHDNAQSSGKVIGEELAAAGFNVDFAPDIDVNSNAANPVIGTRSFSDDPQIVAELGAAFASGLAESGIIATYKHFPGHGDTGTDSHLGVSTVGKTYDELASCDLVPFRSAIANGADLVMTAHITLPEIDDEVTFADGTKGRYPATMSAKALAGMLRGDLGYGGVIVTDALEMKALYQVPLVAGGGDTTEAREASAEYGANLAVKVIEAGGDILLIPKDLINADAAQYYDGYIAALVAKAEAEPAFAARIDESAGRILKMKESHGILDLDASGADADQKAASAEKTIGSDAHRAVEASIARQAVTLLKNEGRALPLSGHGGNTVVFARDSDHVKTIEYAIRRMQGMGLIDANARVVNLESGAATGSVSSGAHITIGFYRDVLAGGGTAVHYTDEMKAAVASADSVVAFSVNNNLTALQPTDNQYLGVSQIMDDAHAAGAKFTLLSSNLPYDAARYQVADAVMCCYMSAGLDDDPTDAAGNLAAYNANVVAALESMFGAFYPTGTLPVNIPAIATAADGSVGYSADETLYPRGFGLSARIPLSGAKASGVVGKTYTGKRLAQTPTVSLGGRKLVEGIDYALSYKNNLNVGAASVYIAGTGWYAGTVAKTFNVNPKGAKLKAVTAGSKKLTVKWAKQAMKMSSSKVTGYRIQYSTSPAFKKGNKYLTVKGAAKTSKTIGKLKAKKKYYVRVQTYKKAGGKTYYSTWSAKKSAKTKK